MPAAAVIPAPIAYIKVVAVKKLVVEDEGVLVYPLLEDSSRYFEKIRVFNAGFAWIY